MRHPKEIGDRSTLAIMFALQLSGHVFAVPFGENTRYDLIVELGGRLRRVQCKTGRLRNGAVVFATCSTYAHHPNPKIRKRHYAGDVDDFAVFCEELGAVYLIPIADLEPQTAACLRVDPPRNNQSRRIRLAKQYEIARFDVS